MAALIKKETGVEVDVAPGGRGEFSVSVGDKKVAEKTRTGFPSDDQVLGAVRAALTS